MKRDVLYGLLAWNGLTAMIGGIMLAVSVTAPPVAWLEHTVFDSYVLPGIFLAAIVGGSAMWSLIAALAHRPFAFTWAVASGIIMISWITLEITLLRQLAWLQLIYLVTGSSIIGLAYRDMDHEITQFHQGHRRRSSVPKGRV